MNPNDDKHEPVDPDKAMRMLELELMQQRAIRQHAGTPYRGLRAASFIFLIFVILGALAAFYYVFFMGGLEAVRTRSGPPPSPSATAISRAP
jgi:hypothetical protein